MMTSPTYQPRHLLSTWSVSFCIHAIVLASAVAFFHDLPRLQPAVYRMEFLLTDPKSVADAATSHEATTVTEHSSLTAPSRSRATSTSSRHIIEQQPPTENSIVQPVVNPVTPAAVEQRKMSPSATTSDSTPVASPTPSDRHVDTLPPVIESRRPTTMNTSRAVERPLMTATPQGATSPIPIAGQLPRVSKMTWRIHRLLHPGFPRMQRRLPTAPHRSRRANLPSPRHKLLLRPPTLHLLRHKWIQVPLPPLRNELS